MVDLTGQKFGKLTVIEITKKRSLGHVVWKCVCDCGNECFPRGQSLRQGMTRSCGCFLPKHGISKLPLYNIWTLMIDRCKNSANINYRYYGARGIKVCERWHKIENFIQDMGERPKGLSLERKDNDGNYEPGNCCWATWEEQANNRRAASCGPRKRHWFFAYNEKTGEWDEDNNQHEFARRHGLISPGNISACLLGKSKHYKGWIFLGL